MTCPTVIRVSTVTGPPGIGLPAGTGDAGKFVRKAGATAYAYELVTPDQVGLPQGLSITSSPTFAGLTLGGFAPSAGSLVLVGANGQLTTVLLGSNLSITNGTLNAVGGGGGGGGYPSLSMPTGFSVSGSGTASLGVTFATGYSLPLSASQASWDTAALQAGTAVQPAALTSALAGKVDTTDARLTDSREWSATTISQAEAEAGSATTRRAFTAQRVFQAAAAWWQGTSTAVGRSLTTAVSQAAGRTALGLGTAATTAASDYATAAQGTKADTAVQPAGLSSYVQTSDSRLSDSREWSAATATQAEAEAGTSTTRLAFTPQRVFHAIAAWWAASAAKTKLDGIATGATANQADAFLLSRANHTGTQAAGTITGLATVATSGAYGDLSGRLVVSSSAPAALAATAAAGSSADAARADHAHARSTYAELGPVADGIVFTISNRGETATASTNYDESLPLSFAVTVTKITFITHIDNTGSSTTTLSAYKRTAAGTKTALLSANATLASGASVATGSLSGTAGVLSLAAGDRFGVDLIGLGTGASGIKCIIEYTRSAA
jgi:hypothetical protein